MYDAPEYEYIMYDALHRSLSHSKDNYFSTPETLNKVDFKIGKVLVKKSVGGVYEYEDGMTPKATLMTLTMSFLTFIMKVWSQK